MLMNPVSVVGIVRTNGNGNGVVGESESGWRVSIILFFNLFV